MIVLPSSSVFAISQMQKRAANAVEINLGKIATISKTNTYFVIYNQF